MEQSNDKEEEILNFKEPNYTFKPNEVHEWRQQGPYLVCKSCELVHANYIGTEKLLVGINEKGQPILKVRASITK